MNVLSDLGALLSVLQVETAINWLKSNSHPSKSVIIGDATIIIRI